MDKLKLELPTALPAAPGTYVLWLRLPAPCTLVVGRLGRFTFPAGHYAYVGSALGPGGLRGRLAHHLRPAGCSSSKRSSPPAAARPHWHVDYLRAAAPVVDVWYTVGRRRRECAWAAALARQPGATRPVPGFGARDCGCAGHLIYFAQQPRSLLGVHTSVCVLGMADSGDGGGTH